MTATRRFRAVAASAGLGEKVVNLQKSAPKSCAGLGPSAGHSRVRKFELTVVAGQCYLLTQSLRGKGTAMKSIHDVRSARSDYPRKQGE